VQLKLLQYDLREVSSERDQLLKWNTQLKKQLNELRRQKGAYLYSLVETEADGKASQAPSAGAAAGADAEAASNNARAAELLGRARADAAQAQRDRQGGRSSSADELAERACARATPSVMQLHDAERAAVAAAAEAQRLVAAANERVAAEEAARKAEAARAVEALRAAERLDGKLEERAAREAAAQPARRRAAH
jgi:hypothetical protein